MIRQADTSLQRKLESAAQKLYDKAYASNYRERDNDVESPMHTDLCEVLAKASVSFNRLITVLDLGCGTGRYFHCLNNLENLIGVDTSFEMLVEARNPVRQSSITGTVNLICANIFEIAFFPRSFDLIYCIGVMGDWCPLDRAFLHKVSSLLKFQGKFVFTITDALSPQAKSWKRSAAYAIRPCVPSFLKRKIDLRLRPFRATEHELKTLMNKSPFSKYDISRRFSPTGRIDLVCIATL